MSNTSDDAILGRYEDLLDETARACLRFMHAHRGRLTADQSYRMAKFVYGCMNQRHTIANRVKLRGVGEFDLILEFVGKAAEVIAEFEASL